MTYATIIVGRTHSQCPTDRAPDGANSAPDVTQVRAYDSNNVMRLRHRIPDTLPLRYHGAAFVELP